MRLVVGLLALTLTGSLARADEAKAPEPKPEVAHAKVPLRVVRMLPETHQALLFDKIRGTHVIADEGGTIDGYKVVSIDDDELTLSLNGSEIVLAAPDQSWRRRERSEPRARRPDARAAASTPADPYADADASPADPYAATAAPAAPADPYAAAPSAPADPYAAPAAPVAVDGPVDPYAPAPLRTVEAPKPVVAGEGGVRVVEADKPAAPVTDAAAPAPAPIANTAAPAPAIDPNNIALKRADLTAALADFGKLASGVRGSFDATGTKIDFVAEGSLFARAGLRAGDVVTAVDGVALKTLDDAAALYARASTARAISVQLLRSGKPLTLKLLIQ